MKQNTQLGTALLVIILAWCAGYIALRANRLQKRLATLEASQRQLQQKHRLLKEDYLQWLQSTGANEQAFRKVIAIVEDRDGVDLVSSIDYTPRANSFPQMRSK